MVVRQIMLMRNHKGDPPSNGKIAGDVSQFVQLRDKFVRKHNVRWLTPLFQEQMKTIWDVDLKELHE